MSGPTLPAEQGGCRRCAWTGFRLIFDYLNLEWVEQVCPCHRPYLENREDWP